MALPTSVASASAATRRLAFWVARSSVTGAVVRTGFAVAPGLLPIETIERRQAVLHCRHPRPSFGSWHHLLVPLASVADVFALAHPRLAAVRAELFGLLDEFSPRPYVLVNAGPRQDVAQVHFHVTDQLPIDLADPPAATWASWESAVRQLADVPGITEAFHQGFSLVQLPSVPGVHLVTT
jgi:hypothetical protein